MSTFNHLSDFADDETAYKGLLKKALGKVKPDPPPMPFLFFKDFPIAGKKVPLFVVDFAAAFPPQLKTSKGDRHLDFTARGMCQSNGDDEVVLDVRSGRLPWKTLDKYFKSIAGARHLHLPADAGDDDEGATQPVAVVTGTAASTQPAFKPPPSPGKAPTLSKPGLAKPEARPGMSLQGMIKARGEVKAIEPSREFKKDEAAPERVILAMSDEKQLKALAADEPALLTSLSAALKMNIDKDSPPELRLGKEQLARLDAALGPRRGKLAAEVLGSMGNSAPTNDALFGWAMDSADVDHINVAAKEKGIAAVTLDTLWRKGRWDEIEKLVGKGWDTGQPKLGGQGYSGFTMPLAHQAAGWLHLIDKNPDQIDPKKMTVPDLELFKDNRAEWLKRRDGVAKVLKAIGSTPVKGATQPSMLTSYDEVKKSPTMDAFREKAGTFWGFENVRMPYVQAAREDKDQGGGGADAMVLRMMDMWAALAKLTNRMKDQRYDELMEKPGKVIDELVAEALSSDDVKGRSAEFAKQFEAEVRTFLQRLVKERNIEDPEITAARGIKAGTGKFMGASLCKHGLEWLRDNGKVLYYCLDGIDERDFVNYRTVKFEQIRAGMAKGEAGGSHDKVITLVELRHIVRNWSTLRETVRFSRRGQLIADQDKMVAEWARLIEEDKKTAGERPMPSDRSKFPDKLKAELKSLAIEALPLSEREAFEITRAAAAVRAAAKAAERSVLAKLLAHKTCDPLFQQGLLPGRDTLVADCTEIATLEAANPKSDSDKLVQARARVGKLAAHPKGGDLPGLIAGWAARRG